jgi:hypothetical protein
MDGGRRRGLELPCRGQRLHLAVDRQSAIGCSPSQPHTHVRMRTVTKKLN